MIFERKTIILKNGNTAILKSPELSDGERMLGFIKQACAETDFLARYPEEWEEVSIESEEKWIRVGRESKSRVIITCYIDGKIAGSCDMSIHGGVKICHRATVAIAILEEYWGLGIGSAMFSELIKCARAHSGTEIVELEFIEGNDRARALYEKFGFEVVGERPNAFRQKDGRLVREYFMQKIL